MWHEGPPSLPTPPLVSPPQCPGSRVLSFPQPLPDPQSPLSSRLKSLTQKNSFWIHRVNCLGTEPHMANCQVQVAPARGKLRPACPGGIHAVVSCVAGPRFRPPKAKPGRKESRAEVGPVGPASGRGTGPPQQDPALGGRTGGEAPGQAGEQARQPAGIRAAEVRPAGGA